MTAFGPECFWFWLHEHFPPNITWCEDRLCSLIVTPFNTWTNLAYLLVSLYTWIKLRKHPNATFRFFSQGAFWVGTSSFVYHASLNFFTQVFDFFGMYVFCYLLVMINFDRVGKWPVGRAGLRQFWIFVVGTTALTTVSLRIHQHFPIQAYVFILILTIIISEVRAPAPPTSPKRVYFWASSASITAAATLSALDATRVVCDPQNHFWQGHGMWHVLGATAMFFTYLHYRLIYTPRGQVPAARA